MPSLRFKDDALALIDPQSVTINAVPFSLPRVFVGGNSSAYQTSDGLIRVTASHQYGKRIRRTLRLDHSKIAPDPLTSENMKFSMSVYSVVDIPTVGYDNEEAFLIWAAHRGYLNASNGAVTTQLLGGES